MGPRIPRKPGQPAKSKKHSDLYTDEDPKGTIHGLGFKTPDKAQESVSKIKKSSRSHNHKTQAAISMEQRAKVMGKSKAAGIYRKFIDSQKAKTKEMKEENELNEVSPPGFGHTKGEDKGGTAAAFDRARKEGRFKGSKSDMFAIMWSQKEKGDKPHYKPGTDKKYKKYQMKEGVVDDLERELLKSKKTDYNSIDKIMNRLSKEYGIKPEELHNDFKSEHAGQTPDAWIKSKLTEEMIDDLFSDPLEELWELYEAVMPKPPLQDVETTSVEGPNTGNFEHPVTQQKKQVNDLIAQGNDPLTSHQSVHGEVDTGDVQSKGKLAATLGRLQDDSAKTGVKVEKGGGSILEKDAEIEKELDDVTHNDLRTPMNKQVPDYQQTPRDQVAEDLSIRDEHDYNEDVAYLQKYGRA